MALLGGSAPSWHPPVCPPPLLETPCPLPAPQPSPPHLLHPKKGGIATPMPMTQVAATTISACLEVKRKLPKGLQMTM